MSVYDSETSIVALATTKNNTIYDITLFYFLTENVFIPVKSKYKCSKGEASRVLKNRQMAE